MYVRGPLTYAVPMALVLYSHITQRLKPVATIYREPMALKFFEYDLLIIDLIPLKQINLAWRNIYNGALTIIGDV
jgi:hypothetical protein